MVGRRNAGGGGVGGLVPDAVPLDAVLQPRARARADADFGLCAQVNIRMLFCLFQVLQVMIFLFIQTLPTRFEASVEVIFEIVDPSGFCSKR